MNTRHYSRVPFHVQAIIRTAGRQFRGGVENLSMRGMFLVTDEQLPVGEAVEIVITLSGVSPEIAISIKGAVCRTAPEGLGFTFDKIDLESYTHLKNIIAYNIDDAEKVIEEICHVADDPEPSAN